MKKIVDFISWLKQKRIPLGIALLIIGACVISILIPKIFYTEEKPLIASSSVPCSNNINQILTDKKELVSPLLMAEIPDESKTLFPLKSKIENYINIQKKENKLIDASVYLLKQNTGDWICINNEFLFNSTGYIRFAVLISYLKVAEDDPSILNKKIFYPPSYSRAERNDSSFVLPAGKSYTVNELLRYMMTYQDTSAKFLLVSNINVAALKKVYSVLGLGNPDFANRKFPINVAGYSKFLQILYNARYLNEANSEYALGLLSDASQKNGMLKLLPTNVKVIHKLSEKFNKNEFELRESGIIYIDDDSYLLTIFATGKDNQLLNESAGEIAKIVYDQRPSAL